MQIDPDYLKRLLEAFQAAPGPLTDIEQLQAAGISYQDPQFVFHMEILQDRGLIQQPDGEPGFGLIRGADWNYQSWSVVPLRLTADGHDFLQAFGRRSSANSRAPAWQPLSLSERRCWRNTRRRP